MINKIADSHFNTLRMAHSIAIKPGESKQVISPEKNDVFDTFMSTPSFSNKQIAIESLIQQITQGNSSYSAKTGTTG